MTVEKKRFRLFGRKKASETNDSAAAVVDHAQMLNAALRNPLDLEVEIQVPALASLVGQKPESPNMASVRADEIGKLGSDCAALAVKSRSAQKLQGKFLVDKLQKKSGFETEVTDPATAMLQEMQKEIQAGRSPTPEFMDRYAALCKVIDAEVEDQRTKEAKADKHEAEHRLKKDNATQCKVLLASALDKWNNLPKDSVEACGLELERSGQLAFINSCLADPQKLQANREELQRFMSDCDPNMRRAVAGRVALPSPGPGVDVQEHWQALDKAIQWHAALLLELSDAKRLDQAEGEGGESTSFFLQDDQGNSQYIYKPSDGEFNPGYGWKQGGGAYREVMASALNDILKENVGIDTGVCPTTLVRLDSPKIQPGNKDPAGRTGAIQALAPATKDFMAFYMSEQQVAFERAIQPEHVENILMLDFMTLQLDRNMENIVVEWSPEDQQEGRPCSLVPIDAGFSFPSADAFKSLDSNFQANGLVQMLQKKKPPSTDGFSDDAKLAIANLDVNAMIAALKQARAAMAQTDANATAMVTDDELEVVRRSVLFLKEASKELTLLQVVEAYTYYFHGILDVDDGNLDAAIADTLRRVKARAAQFAELESLGYKDKLKDLGWPMEAPQFESTDPERLLRVLEAGQVYPVLVEELQKLRQELGEARYQALDQARQSGGNAKLDEEKPIRLKNLLTVAVKKKHDEELIGDAELVRQAQLLLFPSQGPFDADKLRAVADYQRWGGEEMLLQIGKNPEKLSFDQKIESMLQSKYNALGGDDLLLQLGVKYNIPGYNPKKQQPSDVYLKTRLEELELYRKYTQLGGDRAFVQMRGSGPFTKNTLTAMLTYMERHAPALAM